MSTTTTNYGFIKPELTDPADVTLTNPNWDKIDAQLGLSRIQSYTKLEQFGLSDAEMSATDLASNVDKIVTILDDYATNIMLVIQSDLNPNLHASIIAKMNEDTPVTWDATLHAGWVSIRFSGEAYRPVVVEVNLDSSVYYDNVYTCMYNKGASGNQISTFKPFTTGGMIVGSFTGDGKDTKTVEVGVPIKAVVISDPNVIREASVSPDNGNVFLVTPNTPVHYKGNSVIEISGSSINIYKLGVQHINQSGVKYSYIAWY